MQRVVLHGAAEPSLASWDDPRAVDVDVAAIDEHIERAQRVLLAEAQVAETGDADLGAESGSRVIWGSVPAGPHSLSAASALAFT